MQYNDVDILNYVEGKLSNEERDKFDAILENNAELLQRVQLMQASFLPFNQAITDTQEKAPTSLYDFVDESSKKIEQEQQKHQEKIPFFQYFKVAGFAAIIFLAGYFSKSLTINQEPYQQLLSKHKVSTKLVESMITYQALYDRNTVQNATQDLEEAKRVVTSFNKNNNKQLSTPDLIEFGYVFKRVQRLAFEGKPILQFVYLDTAGEPIAICVTPINTNNKTLSQMATQYANMNTILWVDSDNAFMLISKEPQSKLSQIAKALQTS